MLYMLTNYYQNHRRYVNSRDDLQLLGDAASQTVPSTSCQPYEQRDTNDAHNITEYEPIAPCGAIANSFFNGELLCDLSRRDIHHVHPTLV